MVNHYLMSKQFPENILAEQSVLALNANLRRTRDLLLPRLVSGEVGWRKIAMNVSLQMNLDLLY